MPRDWRARGRVSRTTISAGEEGALPPPIKDGLPRDILGPEKLGRWACENVRGICDMGQVEALGRADGAAGRALAGL